MGAVAYQQYIQKAEDERNNKIVKDIIIESQHSNFISSDTIDSICKKVDGGKGDRADMCYDQLDGTRKSGQSESVTQSYWKAVGKGYKGTIEQFAKKKDAISKGLGLAMSSAGALTGLLSSKSNQGTDYKQPDPVDDTRKPISKTAKIVIASSVALAIGIVAFIAFRKK